MEVDCHKSHKRKGGRSQEKHVLEEILHHFQKESVKATHSFKIT